MSLNGSRTRLLVSPVRTSVLSSPLQSSGWIVCLNLARVRRATKDSWRTGPIDVHASRPRRRPPTHHGRLHLRHPSPNDPRQTDQPCGPRMMKDPDAQNQHTVPYDQTPWSPPYQIPSYGGNGLGAGSLLEQMMKQRGVIPGGTTFPSAYLPQYVDARPGRQLPPAIPNQNYLIPDIDALRLYSQMNPGFANALAIVRGMVSDAAARANPYV